ncbi:putative F-box protein At1g67623 [Solanum stenotomum]|uniref:putative F-box protein At1g67623 n=1 Tax=Solanum stenotomum TaxID=172797 RepID=UPI0020D16211|nr:putative F-box protein At1g67623 [Solanum stenotomum]
MLINGHSRKNMKRTARRRNSNNKVIEENSCSSILLLPRVLLTEIVAKVASSSFKDLINVKLSCKIFNKVAKKRYVYQKVTLVDFPIEPSWKKQTQEKINGVTSFMEQCRKCGNTEALYRKGVVDFFKNDKPEVAMEFLKQAANGDHFGALYVIGIIGVFLGDEYKQKGVKLIGIMKETEALRKITRQCRKSLVEILKIIWVKNPLILGKRPSRCTIQHEENIRRNGWLDSDDEHVHIHCDACSCDVEIAYIIDVLPTY